MMKNDFYFTSIALYFLKIFNFLPWLFGHTEKTALLERVGYFKINNITTWLTNNQNTHIAQYLTKQRQSDNDIWSVNRI